VLAGHRHSCYFGRVLLTDKPHPSRATSATPWREKLSYGVADTGFNFYWANIATFLTIFYTDVFGISAAAAASMLATIKLVNAFADPLIGEQDRAFRLLRQLLPGPDPADYRQRGQLPIFIPNYYRDAYRQHPGTAGRSSRLFHTGSASWLYRCLIDGLFGVKGDRQGLVLQPQLPRHWNRVRVIRAFRGATFDIDIHRVRGARCVAVEADGQNVPDCRIRNLEAGKRYRVVVAIPD